MNFEIQERIIIYVGTILQYFIQSLQRKHGKIHALFYKV